MKNAFKVFPLFVFLFFFLSPVFAVYFQPVAQYNYTVPSSASFAYKNGIECTNATDNNLIYCWLIFADNTDTIIYRLNFTNLSKDIGCSIYGSYYVHAITMYNSTHGYGIGGSPAKGGAFYLKSEGVCSQDLLVPMSWHDPFDLDFWQNYSLIYINNDGAVLNTSWYFKYYSGAGDTDRISLADTTPTEIYVDDNDGDIIRFFGDNSSYDTYSIDISDFYYRDRWEVITDGNDIKWLVGVKKYDSTHIGVAKYNLSYIQEQYEEEGYESNETETEPTLGYDFTDLPSDIGATLGLGSDTSNLLFSLIVSLAFAIFVFMKTKSDTNIFLLVFIATFIICWAVGLVPNYVMFLIGFIGAVLVVNKFRS